MIGITLVLTYACNQDCSYCYQIKNTLKMEFETARKTIDYFCNNGNGEVVIKFYGGEPFLEFDLMKRIIEYSLKQVKEKGGLPKFTVTTNGSLLDRKNLLYCYQKGIDIYLSIDGTKQAHENGRGSGSYAKIQKVLSLYQSLPDIPLKIQSVITPDNVKYLLQSVRFLVSQGVSELFLNFCYDYQWNRKNLETLKQQYSKVYNYLFQYKSQGGKIRFNEFTRPDPLQPVFQCDAGRERFAVTPDGLLYGCSMYIPWSKRAVTLGNKQNFDGLCLGSVDELAGKRFQERLERLYGNELLCGQYYRYTCKTKCRDCEYIMQCAVCPAWAMVLSADYLKIPHWICEINKTLFEAGRAYWV